MKTFSVVATALVAVAGLATSAQAALITLTANLSGVNEVPAVTTPASGIATVVIDTDTRAWTMNLSFSGLSAPVTVAHIHRAPVGANGPVIIGLDGISLSGGRPWWNLIAPGSTSLNTGGALNAPFLFPAAELNNLLLGNTYVNIHSSAFPGGEIRGNLIPSPSALALLGVGGLAMGRRRRGR
jgi:hypothetical protein